MMAKQRFDLQKNIRASACFSTWTYGVTGDSFIVMTAPRYTVDIKEMIKLPLLGKPLLT